MAYESKITLLPACRARLGEIRSEQKHLVLSDFLGLFARRVSGPGVTGPQSLLRAPDPPSLS